MVWLLRFFLANLIYLLAATCSPGVKNPVPRSLCADGSCNTANVWDLVFFEGEECGGRIK